MWRVVTLLCGMGLMGLPRAHAGNDGLVLLANNLARGIAHKWVMERCPIQEGMFMDLYPIVLAEHGKGVRPRPGCGSAKTCNATPTQAAQEAELSRLRIIQPPVRTCREPASACAVRGSMDLAQVARVERACMVGMYTGV